MDLAAVDPEGRVVLPHRLGVRRLEQAVDLAVGIVEQFRLAHSKPVRLLSFRLLGYLLDRLGRQVQLVVV